MSKTIHWGILGCGSMAQKFVQDLLMFDDVSITAVASRSEERALNFARKNGISKHYSSYEELAKDPEIDIIYIATRHPQHAENSLLCLNHGKHVLCEKPMAMNLQQAEQVIQAAREKDLFFMEAVWTRFFPMTKLLKKKLEEGELGELKFIQADFGFRSELGVKERLYDKTQGGGSLLDIGIYPLFISLLALGMPQGLKANAVFSETGVDESCSIILEYSNGAMASLNSTFTAFTPGEAWFHGSEGSLKLHRMFHESERLSHYINMQHQQTWEATRTGLGYVYEIQHVNECLGKGLIESPLMSHNDSLNLTRLLDWTREEIGLEY